MSTPAPEAPARGGPAAPARPAAGTGFAKKIGPLPIWGWTAIAAAAGVGYVLWRRAHPKAAASSTSTSTSTTTESQTDYAGEISTLQAEIQQLQGAPSTSSSTGTATGPPKYKAVKANGKESLNKIAKAHHTSAAAIAEFTLTNKKQISADLRKYLTSANYQRRAPEGLTFWIPE
jgi:hypothetical protein